MPDDQKWMKLAIEEAQKAMSRGELPIACVLVAGEKLLAKGQTRVGREKSPVAHGELMLLLSTKDKIYNCQQPLVLYTTLEPCVMCLGAAINCGVDKIVFGMRAKPDGGTAMAAEIVQHGPKVPEIVGGVLEKECVALFASWPGAPEHPANGYYTAVLEGYTGRK